MFPLLKYSGRRTLYYREAVKTMRHSPEEGFAQLEKLGAIREVSILDRGQIVADRIASSELKGGKRL